MLERRLDNVVYRLGFAMSRRQARQLVRHGHVSVNGRKVDIPSFQVKVGDEVAVRDKSIEQRSHPGRVPDFGRAWPSGLARDRQSRASSSGASSRSRAARTSIRISTNS